MGSLPRRSEFYAAIAAADAIGGRVVPAELEVDELIQEVAHACSSPFSLFQLAYLVAAQTLGLVPTDLIRRLPVETMVDLLRSFGQLLVEGFQQTIHVMIERMAESVNKQATERTRSRREMRLTDLLKELSLADCSPLTPIAAVIEYNVDLHAPCEDWATEKQGKSRVTLPIQFDAAVDVLVYGKMVIPVKFQSRGTISGDFMNKKNRPDSINIEIDSDELYKAMKKQCKHVLKKAISSLSCEDDDSVTTGETKSDSDSSLFTMENEFGEPSPNIRGSSKRDLTESVISTQ